MAAIITEVLNTQGMGLVLACRGMSKVGFNLSGTWVGTASFFFSQDAVNFVRFPLSVTPFPSGTTVQTATANGSWEANVLDFAAVKIVATTLTSGSMIAKIGGSIDSSYQDTFLASSSRFVSQETAGGTVNTITQAAQANRAWRLRTCTGSFSVAPAAAVKVTVSDGPSSNLWEESVAAAAGQWKLNLPADPGFSTPPGYATGGGGVVNTPGNSMVVTVTAPGGSVVTALNCEFIAQ